MSPPDASSSQPTERFVQRGDRRLHLLEWPNPQARSTLVAIHGGCANAHWWCASAPTLRRSRRIIALDLAGHGHSDTVGGGEYSLAGHRDDLCHIVRELGLRNFALMGHSFGGFVSLAALPELAGDLSALILVDSRGHIRRRSARYLNALAKFPNPRYSSEEAALESFQLLPRATAASAEVLAHVARKSIRRTADGDWSLAFDRSALRAAEERSFAPEMSAWRGPTLLLRGSESTALSARALAELATEMDDTEAVEIPDAHHHIMLDQPTRFATAVDGFLRRRVESAQSG